MLLRCVIKCEWAPCAKREMRIDMWLSNMLVCVDMPP